MSRTLEDILRQMGPHNEETLAECLTLAEAAKAGGAATTDEEAARHVRMNCPWNFTGHPLPKPESKPAEAKAAPAAKGGKAKTQPVTPQPAQPQATAGAALTAESATVEPVKTEAKAT